MFGKGWEQGQAKIVACEMDLKQRRYGINVEVATNLHHKGWIYIADVQPDNGGSPFRATFRERFANTGEFHQPRVDEQVRVSFDPKSQNKVKFDRSELSKKISESKSADKARLEEISKAAPGSEIPPRSSTS